MSDKDVSRYDESITLDQLSEIVEKILSKSVDSSVRVYDAAFAKALMEMAKKKSVPTEDRKRVTVIGAGRVSMKEMAMLDSAVAFHLPDAVSPFVIDPMADEVYKLERQMKEDLKSSLGLIRERPEDVFCKPKSKYHK